MKKERVGIYGGSFSPPHMGHIRAAETFLREMELDRLLIVPAGVPPHKQIAGGVSAEARFEMCKAAFVGIPGIEVSDLELKKEGVSYTVDTLRLLAAEERELYLLCGDDMFLTLDSWREPSEIFRLANIVSMRRYEDGEEKLRRKGEAYAENFGARVHYINAEPFPLSSTEVRNLLCEGRCTREYLPSGVMEIIEKFKLYSTKSKENND